MGLLSIFKKERKLKKHIKRVKRKKEKVKKKKAKKIAVKVIKKELKKAKKEKITKGILVDDVVEKDFLHFDTHTSIGRALELMSVKSIDEAIVIKNGKPIGIVRDEDLADFLTDLTIPDKIKENQERLRKLANEPITKVMNKEVCKVKSGERLDKVLRLIERCDSHILCVVDHKGKLIGIITPDTVLKILRDVVRLGSSYDLPILKTGVDELYDLVDKYKKIKSKKAANILKIDEKKIEEWAEILEKEGLIDIDYPITGGLLLIKK